MQVPDVTAALPTADHPVWNWTAVVSFVLTVVPEVLKVVLGEHDLFGIPEAWVGRLQVVLLVVGVISAKLGTSPLPRTEWTEAERTAKLEGGSK